MPTPVTRRSFVTTSALAGAMLTAPAVGVEMMACAPESAAPAQDAGTAAPETPDQLMRRMIGGFQLTQLLYVATKLNIADHLANGPQAVTQLATVTESHADSLYRVLRALAGFGVFAEDEGRRFRLTPAAELLRTGVPDL